LSYMGSRFIVTKIVARFNADALFVINTYRRIIYVYTIVVV